MWLSELALSQKFVPISEQSSDRRPEILFDIGRNFAAPICILFRYRKKTFIQLTYAAYLSRRERSHFTFAK